MGRLLGKGGLNGELLFEGLFLIRARLSNICDAGSYFKGRAGDSFNALRTTTICRTIT